MKELFDIIKKVDFPANQYVQEMTKKYQAVLHHTGSGDDSRGDVYTWRSNTERVATPLIIERNGKIIQLFSSTFWAYALGISSRSNTIDSKLKLKHTLREQGAAQVELDSWGRLKFDDGVYKSWTGAIVPNDKVITYPKNCGTRHAGNSYEKYTQNQIDSLRLLLLYWNSYHGIPLDYQKDMWDVSIQALDGNPGIYTHCSYVTANLRDDCHPQPELIAMLKSLKK
jgi:hypothetical protein